MRLSSSRVSQRRTGRAEGLVFKIYTFLQGKNLHTGLSRPGGSVLCRKGCDAPWSAGRAGSAAEPQQRIPSVQPKAEGRGGWFARQIFSPWYFWGTSCHVLSFITTITLWSRAPCRNRQTGKEIKREIFPISLTLAVLGWLFICLMRKDRSVIFQAGDAPFNNASRLELK